MTQQHDNSLEHLQAMICEFSEERDWDQFHNPKDLSISIVLESTEVLEHFQWKNHEEMSKHSTDKKDDIGEELADVLSYLLLLANKLNINLADAYKDKMKKNRAKYPIEKSKGNHKKYTELTGR